MASCEKPRRRCYDPPGRRSEKYLRQGMERCPRLVGMRGRILDFQATEKDLRNPTHLREFYEETKSVFVEDLKELSEEDFDCVMLELEKWLYTKEYITSPHEVALLAIKDVAIQKFIDWIQPDSSKGLERVKEFWRTQELSPPERSDYISGLMPRSALQVNSKEEGLEVQLRQIICLQIGPRERRNRLQSTPH